MTIANKKFQVLKEQNQNYWHLTSILGASLGLTGSVIGPQVANQYGAGVAITSIWIGNIILWLISYAMLSMSFQYRKNAIENVEEYLGRPTAISNAFILIISFLGWYILQLNSFTTSVTYLFPNKFNNYDVLRTAIALGLFTALIAMGGIKLIRNFSVTILPFLLLFYIVFSFLNNSKIDVKGSWGFSLIATIAIIKNNLVGIINIPTLFRHVRSKQDAMFALILMTLIVSGIQTITVFATITQDGKVFQIPQTDFLVSIKYFALMSIVFSVIGANLVNIYFASAGWELIIPHIWTPKEYVIVGLLGTVAFTFLQISKPMEFLENMTGNFIANIGIALLMAFIIRMLTKHRPRILEKSISTACLVVGCLITSFIQIKFVDWNSDKVLVAGTVATLLAFLIVVFIEEATWSIKKIFFLK